MNGEIGAKVEFGDFQTPVDFAQSVCEYIKQAIQFQPARIIDQITTDMIQSTQLIAINKNCISAVN